jgi:hypothetical protein
MQTTTGFLSRQVDFRDSMEGATAAIEEYFERGWTDGLPVVPPTEALVTRMLATVGQAPQVSLGPVPPRMAQARIEALAINAVMAGCKPEYFPVVVAAVGAMLDPHFNLNGVQATTSAVGPLTVVHGPVAQQIGVNGGLNAFGSGYRANATIGRAIRLILLNLGGGQPGVGDMAQLGGPHKYSYCIAENEAESPWEPFHTERGFGREDSAVTVFACESPHIIIGGLDSIAHALSNTTFGSMFGGEFAVVVTPLFARQLAEKGWTRHDFRMYLFEHGRIPLRKLWKSFGKEQISERYGTGSDGERWPAWIDLDDPETLVPSARRPENIHVFVTGGTTMPFAAILTGFGYLGGLSVTRPVTL